MITYDDIRSNEKIRTYIIRADESLTALGYTEHSFSHVVKAAETAKYILGTLGYPEREQELAQIAAYLHDIGNVINRIDHAQSGAVMAFRILEELGMPASETSTVITAIGNHDEGTAVAVNPVAAALILSDKTDVRRSRVRNQDPASFDIHDRVNFSVVESSVEINDDHTVIKLQLTIDTTMCSIMDYFEIFLTRMVLCRKAAARLGLEFRLVINGQQLL